MTGMSGTGATIGLLAGAGFALVLARLPWGRQVRLDDRLEPYLRDTAPSRLLLTGSNRVLLGPLERLTAPLMADAVRWLERVLGGSGSVRRRLDQLGPGHSLEQFRAEQVV